MNTTEEFSDTDTGCPEPVQHVGAELFAARSASGHALDDIATELNIRSDHLRALEEGWWDELPSQAYAVGFLKSYARYLGLDAADIVARYKDENRHFECDVITPCNNLRPQPIEESRIPKMPIVIMSAFLALAGYCGWYFMEGTSYVAADTTGVIPEHLAALVAEEAPQALANAPVANASVAGETLAPVQVASVERALVPAPKVSQPAVPQLAAIRVSASEKIAMVTTPKRTIRPLAKSAPSSRTIASALSRFSGPSLISPANAATGDDYPDSRITLRARADTWILVEDPASGTLRQGVLRAGEQYKAPNEKGLTLTTSNLKALEIIVDGSPVPPQKDEGTIARNLPLDADKLAAL